MWGCKTEYGDLYGSLGPSIRNIVRHINDSIQGYFLLYNGHKRYYSYSDGDELG
jgi:hypothetical protein